MPTPATGVLQRLGPHECRSVSYSFVACGSPPRLPHVTRTRVPTSTVTRRRNTNPSGRTHLSSTAWIRTFCPLASVTQVSVAPLTVGLTGGSLTIEGGAGDAAPFNSIPLRSMTTCQKAFRGSRNKPPLAKRSDASTGRESTISTCVAAVPFGSALCSAWQPVRATDAAQRERRSIDSV
jgi:hypothetical protein